MAIDPERWQCCITRNLLNMVQDGRSEEALDVLLGQLLDPEMPGMCDNLAKCQPRSCQARQTAREKATRPTEAVR